MAHPHLTVNQTRERSFVHRFCGTIRVVNMLSPSDWRRWRREADDAKLALADFKTGMATTLATGTTRLGIWLQSRNSALCEETMEIERLLLGSIVGRQGAARLKWRGMPPGLAVAGGLGTQYRCRRGVALLDHLPDDGRENLMAPPNLCYPLS